MSDSKGPDSRFYEWCSTQRGPFASSQGPNKVFNQDHARFLNEIRDGYTAPAVEALLHALECRAAITLGWEGMDEYETAIECAMIILNTSRWILRQHVALASKHEQELQDDLAVTDRCQR